MNAIEKAQQALKKKREAGEIQRLDPIAKALQNPNSLRLAINAKCWECVCGSILEIRKCSSPTCPLYTHRPYK